ncbi:MAG: TonB-dependent receptor [Bacteroidia bacterium]|nr:TonB-dependent receptor [Bacteroidia bacterium]
MNLCRLVCLVAMLIPVLMFGQVTVNGKITDAQDNNPIVGAAVVEKGTNNGVFSQDNGNFTIQVQEGASLTITYLGFKTVELTASSNMNITLEQDIANLDEVVIVGYTAQQKKDITAAISIVDLETIENTPYSNVIQALAGQVAGIGITQDGQPGQGRTSIKVRGVTTLNNNNPLFVIDGLPTEESIDNLNPNDIESIQILKDAASASIYGSRSAGGVVVITTKKGKAGKLSINAGTQIGLQTIANQIDVLDPVEWGNAYWEAARNDGQTNIRHPLYDEVNGVPVLNTTPFIISNQRQVYDLSLEGTNWSDEVYSNSVSHQHFLNISNGNQKGSYMAGVSYFDQDGLIDNTYFDRITGRFNSQLNLTDWLSVGENFSVSFSEQVQVGTQQGQDGIPTDVIRQHPALPVFDVAGAFAGKIAGLPDVRNMVSVLEKNRDNTTENWRVFGNAYVQADLFKLFDFISDDHKLIAKTTLGVDYSNFYVRRFEARFSEGDFDVQNNVLTNEFGKGLTTTAIHTLNYQLNKSKHRFQALAGMEVISYDFEFLRATRNDFLIEDPAFTFLQAGAGDQTNFGGGSGWGRLSYFGRGDYTFNDKYILSATLRYDRTSRFDSAGFFPAVSLGWWLSEEDFFKNTFGNSTSLKVRTSYGIQGNDRAVDNPFADISTLGPNFNNADYDIAGTNTGVTQGFRVISKGNPLLKWEQTAQFNVGFDLLLWDGKFNLNFDYYNKNTTDILLRPTLLAAEGEGTPPVRNVGTVRNNGIDLGLGYRTTTDKGFYFEVNAQMTYFRNEIVDFGSNIGLTGNAGETYLILGPEPTRAVVGRPVVSFYGWVTDGLFQNEGEVESHVEQNGAGPGRIRYSNINNDSLINDLDRDYFGNPYPDVTAGLNLVAAYKGISLAANVYGAFGHQVYNFNRQYTDFTILSNFNRGQRVLDAWTPENSGSTIPALTLANANNELRVSDYFVEDADYVRLRSVRVSYALPKSITNKFKITIYGEVQNVFTITNYTGIDPEVPFTGSSGDANALNYPGLDLGAYPLPRTFLGGVNVDL